MNTATSAEEPKFIIRLPKRERPQFSFYCEEAPTKTTVVPGQATRFTESQAHQTLGIQMGIDVDNYSLFRGSKVMPVSRMLDPEEIKMIIRFHVASGKTSSEGAEIKEIVRAIVKNEYPNAEIIADHWDSGVRNFCHLANYQPLSYPQAHAIEQHVMDIIKRVSKKVPTRELNEVYDYA